MKNKFYKKNQKRIHAALVFVLVQILIIILFVRSIEESKPIDIHNTKCDDVIVESILYERGINEYIVSIYSESVEYKFVNLGSSSEYSNSELYNCISVGDKISIVYYEENSVFLGKCNWVIDARTETDVYRSINEYYKSTNGVDLVVGIIFVVFEIVFIGALCIYIWLYKT